MPRSFGPPKTLTLPCVVGSFGCSSMTGVRAAGAADEAPVSFIVFESLPAFSASAELFFATEVLLAPAAVALFVDSREAGLVDDFLAAVFLESLFSSFIRL